VGPVVEITPASNAVGWVVSNEATGNHFGDDDMYTGVFNNQIYHGAVQFDLSGVPSGAELLGAEVILTGQTREYLGTGGEWNLRFLEPGVDAAWPGHNYQKVHDAAVLHTIPPTLYNGDLAANRQNTFTFEQAHLAALQARLSTTRLASFRLDGPASGANNAFSWDSGYGPGNIGAPPRLVIWYRPGGSPGPSTPTPSPVTVDVTPAENAVGWVRQQDSVANHFGDDDIYAGVFNNLVYLGAIQFNLSSIPASAQVLSAEVRLTGQTREYLLPDGGQWSLRLLASGVDPGWPNHTYEALSNAQVLDTIPPVLNNGDLDRQRVNVFAFRPDQLPYLQDRLRGGAISFRVDGPTAGANNTMSWDSGYGAGGLGIKPVLRITYRPTS